MSSNKTGPMDSIMPTGYTIDGRSGADLSSDQIDRLQIPYDAAQVKDIQGIEYTKLQTEYQRFPEEFFTGSDLTIYFEHLWINELTSLAFSLNEQVQPIYGYNSYTWDSVARGNRVVQGYFRIPFKEAGYLYTALNLIGAQKEAAAPALGYLLGGENELPKWIADIKQTMEDMLFEQYAEHNMWTTEIVTKTREVEKDEEVVTYVDGPAWVPWLKWGQTSENVKALHKIYNERKVSGIVEYREWKDIKTWTQKEMFQFGSGYKQYNKYHQHNKVKEIQKRLNILQPVIAPKDKQLKIDGFQGPLTTAMVKSFQKFAKVLKVDGIIGPKTGEQLSYGFSGHNSGYFGTACNFVTYRFQQLRKLKVDGIVGPETQKALGVGGKTAKKTTKKVKVEETYTEEVRRRKTEQEIREEMAESDTPQPAEDLYTDYERGVWSRAFDPTRRRDYQPFFYRSEDQEFLTLEGFDIYINYGPLPEAIMQNQGHVPDTVNFNTTVKAIRNIQLTGCEQVLNADGTPIEEVYYFIAKDID